MAERRVAFLGNYRSAAPHPVFQRVAARLAGSGIEISVDNQWSDAYRAFDLLVLDEPVPDSDDLADCRILGQRTLNRRTRLDVAVASGAAVAPFGGPRSDAELDALAQSWATDCAVLKYDWSSRRRGVFLWPLARDRRKPFPPDFDPTADVFMAFQSDDPHTYKVDAFGGVVLGAYILKTRDMRQPAWEMVGDADYARFELPDTVRLQIEAVSAALLGHGAGYASFDLMRSGEAFRIIEMNTCGVGTGLWDDWPELYAEAYGRALLRTLEDIDRVPRYRDLRAAARRCGNDRQAIVLPRRPSGTAAGAAAPPAEDSAQVRFMRTLGETERISAHEMRDFLAEPLEALIRHAREQVPFYAERLDPLFAADGSLDLGAWARVPITTRSDVARNRSQFIARSLPTSHGSVSHVPTPGTEHEPLSVSTSRLAAAVASCIGMRFFLWHGIPFTDAMATIRNARPLAAETRNWAAGWAAAERGPHFELSSETPVVEQLRWLKGLGPVWLRTRPSLAQQMALAIRERPELKPDLRGVLTSGEILAGDQRQLCRDFLGHAPRDLYELREAGTVALQCPQSDAYHVQSEAVLVELLDAHGQPCAKGATGRVVVTPLYNLAMPLIRYDTGDLAVAGDRFDPAFVTGRLCVCGRRLLRFQRVLGRARNQLSLSAGGSVDAISTLRLHELTGARLWQLVQRDAAAFVLRLDTAGDEEPRRDAGQAAAHVTNALGARAQVSVEWKDLARIAGIGRFEPTVSQPMTGRSDAPI